MEDVNILLRIVDHAPKTVECVQNVPLVATEFATPPKEKLLATVPSTVARVASMEFAEKTRMKPPSTALQTVQFF